MKITQEQIDFLNSNINNDLINSIGKFRAKFELNDKDLNEVYMQWYNS